VEVDLLLVPYDSGLRATRMGRGPARLVESGLIEGLARAGSRGRIHSLETQRLETRSELPAEIATAFELARRLSEAVAEAWDAGRLPAVLAGNCFSAVGTVAGLGAGATAVIWFDAHGDLNTPSTTTSGFLDGMALATLMGYAWDAMARAVPGYSPVAATDVLLVGARDLDPPEVEALAAWGIQHVSVDQLRRAGPGAFMARVASAFGPWVDRAYIHVDLDVLDPAEGRANHLAVPGGLTAAEVVEAIDGVGQHLHLGALALTSYDPAVDPSRAVPEAAGQILRGFVRAADNQSDDIRLRPDSPAHRGGPKRPPPLPEEDPA